jgi:transcriptional regulator with XRE-family HTH domain
MERSFVDLVSLGAAVRDARQRRGFTQAELAGRAGVSRQFVISLERGAGPRAELGKVLSVIRALNLAMSLRDDDAAHADDRTPSIADLLDHLDGDA